MSQRANYVYTRYNGTAVANLGTGVGLLHSINITGTSLGTLIVRDHDTTTSRGTIAILKTDNLGSYLYDAQFNQGLRIETPSNSLLVAPDVTITWTLGL